MIFIVYDECKVEYLLMRHEAELYSQTTPARADDWKEGERT